MFILIFLLTSHLNLYSGNAKASEHYLRGLQHPLQDEREEVGIHQECFGPSYQTMRNKLGDLSKAPASPRTSCFSLLCFHSSLHFSALIVFGQVEGT